jgi:hypothetical protein
MKKAMDFPLTERLRGCDTAGGEACARMVCHGFAGFTMKYPGERRYPNVTFKSGLGRL